MAALGEHADVVRLVKFTSDGRTVASLADDQVVKLWDLARAAASDRHDRRRRHRDEAPGAA